MSSRTWKSLGRYLEQRDRDRELLDARIEELANKMKRIPGR